MKYFSLIFLFVASFFTNAQTITSTSASYVLNTNYTNGAPNDQIFGFCTPINNTAVLGSLTATGPVGSTFEWTIYNSITNTYNPFTTQFGSTSTINNLSSGGYHIKVTNSSGVVVACDLAWVWVNQTNSNISYTTVGCSGVNLNATATPVSNFTYYNPPSEPFLVSATTSISVTFNATHTFISDLGFYLVGPASCGSPIVTLSPNPGSNGQGAVCNSGDNINNLTFTTVASPNFNPCTATAPYTGTYDSYGLGTNINWSTIYGCNAANGGWSVQIYDCIGADVGSLTNASISFTGNSGCGASTINYNSGNINSAINDNSCSSASASIYTVPNANLPVVPITINNTITYSWSSNPSVSITNQNTLNASANITQDTWFYFNVIDNFGCVKIDSLFVDFIQQTPATITPVGSVCVNSQQIQLSTNIAGGVWSGSNISTSGLFNPILVGTNTLIYTIGTAPCDTFSTIDILVNPQPTINIGSNSPICQNGNLNLTSSGGINYNWSGPNFTSNSQNPSIIGVNTINSGIYQVIVTDNNSCKDTSTINVIVNPLPTVNIFGQNVCVGSDINLTSSGGLTYSWSGPNLFISNQQNPTITNANINNSGNYIVTVTDLNNCVNGNAINIIVNTLPTINISSNSPLCVGSTLNLTSSGGSNYTWSSTSLNSNSQNVSIPNIQISDLYNLVVSDQNGCVSDTSINVIVNALPTINISSNSPLCVGSTLNLTSSGGVNYTWSSTNFNSNLQNPSIQNIQGSSTYNLIVTDLNGCVNDTFINTTINTLPVLLINSTSICVGDNTTLNVSGANTYQWSPINMSGSSQIVSPNITTIYTITGTDLNSCQSQITSTVTVNPLPILSTNSTSICIGDNVTLNVSGANTYQWSPINMSGSSQIVSPNTTTIYTIIGTDLNSCQSQITSTVTVNPLPIANISSDISSGCKPLCVNLSSNSTNQALWIIDGQITNIQNPNHCFNNSGTYNIEMTIVDQNGCENTDIFNINVFNDPYSVFSASPQPTTILNSEISFANMSLGSTSYFWEFGDSTNSNDINPTHIYNYVGEYSVTLVSTNINGCTDTSRIIVIIDPDYSIYIPDAFSPNNDGVNDYFTLKGEGITKFKISIFNRWGELIYESNDINKGWDGRYKDNIVQQDVYIYKIELVLFDSTKKLKSGHVTVIR